MLTHHIRPADELGFVQVTDARTGNAQRVFVGETAAERLTSAAEIRPQSDAPSQRWASVVGADVRPQSEAPSQRWISVIANNVGPLPEAPSQKWYSVVTDIQSVPEAPSQKWLSMIATEETPSQKWISVIAA